MDSGGWSYSPEAVKLLEEFLDRFPVMFDYLIKSPGEERYYETELFPNPAGSVFLYVVPLETWLVSIYSMSCLSVGRSLVFYIWYFYTLSLCLV